MSWVRRILIIALLLLAACGTVVVEEELPMNPGEEITFSLEESEATHRLYATLIDSHRLGKLMDVTVTLTSPSGEERTVERRDVARHCLSESTHKSALGKDRYTCRFYLMEFEAEAGEYTLVFHEDVSLGSIDAVVVSVKRYD